MSEVGVRCLQRSMRSHIVIDLIVFISKLHIIFLCKSPPALLDLQSVRFESGTVQTYQSSNPFGGFRRYRRLYSFTASFNVLLCLATFFFHLFCALSINSCIGCFPVGFTIKSPLGWKVWDRSASRSAFVGGIGGGAFRCMRSLLFRSRGNIPEYVLASLSVALGLKTARNNQMMLPTTRNPKVRLDLRCRMASAPIRAVAVPTPPLKDPDDFLLTLAGP